MTIRTPCIDAFAERATIFDRAYCTSFPTIPTRTDMFTGRFTFPFRGWTPLPADEKVRVYIAREGLPTWFARVLGIGCALQEQNAVPGSAAWHTAHEKPIKANTNVSLRMDVSPLASGQSDPEPLTTHPCLISVSSVAAACLGVGTSISGRVA